MPIFRLATTYTKGKRGITKYATKNHVCVCVGNIDFFSNSEHFIKNCRNACSSALLNVMLRWSPANIHIKFIILLFVKTEKKQTRHKYTREHIHTHKRFGAVWLTMATSKDADKISELCARRLFAGVRKLCRQARRVNVIQEYP